MPCCKRKFLKIAVEICNVWFPQNGYPLVNKHSNGKSPFSIGNTSSNGGFSIAMFVYRRVIWRPHGSSNSIYIPHITVFDNPNSESLISNSSNKITSFGRWLSITSCKTNMPKEQMVQQTKGVFRSIFDGPGMQKKCVEHIFKMPASQTVTHILTTVFVLL